MDQASELASRLGMEPVAGPSLRDGSGAYGNATLVRAGLGWELMRHEGLSWRLGCEPRSALWVRVEEPCGGAGGERVGAAGGDAFVDVLNTHLSFRRFDRPRQIGDLLGERWMTSPLLGPAAVLVGDLNCTPGDRGLRRLARVWRNAGGPGGTWPTRWPVRRLDHVLASAETRVWDAGAVRPPGARWASDHYPVAACVSGRSETNAAGDASG